jgi:DnaJ family protein C protein 27
MWDLSGSAEYADVRNELYSGTDAIFVVYDVTNAASFEAVDSWLREANRFSTGSPDIYIIANKVGCSSWFYQGT